MKLIIKLPLAFLSIAMFVLIAGYYSAGQTQKIMEKTIGEDAVVMAQEALHNIDISLRGRIDLVQGYFEDLILKEIISSSNREFGAMEDAQGYITAMDRQWTSVEQDAVLPFMQELMDRKLSRNLRLLISSSGKRKNNFNDFKEIFVTNKYGANIALSNKTSDYYQADEAWWQQAKANGVFVGDVEYDQSSKGYSIPIAIRIDGLSGEFLGVLKAVLDIDRLTSQLEELKRNMIYKREVLSLVTKDGKLLYSTEPYKFLEDYSDRLVSRYGHIREPTHVNYLVYRRGPKDEQNLVVHAHASEDRELTDLGWILLVEYPISEIFAPVFQLRRTLLIISFLLAVLAIFIGIFVSHRIIIPVNKLKSAAVRIGRGRLDSRVDLEAKDEFRELGEAFNGMASNLKETTVSKEYINNIIKTMLDCLIVIDLDAKIRTVNKATCDLLGYSEDELIGNNVNLLFVEEEEGTIFKSKKLEILIEKGMIANYEVDFKAKNGKKIPMLLSGAVMKTIDGPDSIVVVAKDITERKKAAEALKQSEKRFMDVLHSSQDAILLIDKETFVDANEATVKMLKYSDRQEFLMTHPSELSPPIQPDGQKSFDKANEMMRIALEKGFHRFEWMHRKKTGEDFPVEVSLTPIVHEGRPVIHCLWRDLTEIKKAKEEKEALEAQVRHSEKMESIGTMANGIAHNFNNILAAIRGLIEMTLMDMPEDSRNRADLEKAVRSVEEAKNLADKMLLFSRGKEQKYEQVEIHRVVDDAIDFFESSITNQIRLQKDIDSACGLILGDANEIKQVIMNLCRNAYQAMAGNPRGVIGVQLKAVEVDSDMTRKHTNLREGRYACLVVSDTGEGMDKETRERIFEPFFTTKEVGKGTGIGLSMAHGTILSHNGQILVNSEPGKGTTFEVYFPLLSGDQERKEG